MGSYLDNDIKFLKGVGERRAILLGNELGIFTLRDLLWYFPFRHIDRTKIYRISEINEESPAWIQFRGRIDNISMQGAGRKKRLVLLVSDGSGTAELVWFSGVKWIEKKLIPGREYIVFGRPGFFNGRLSIVHPELEEVSKIGPRPTIGVQGVYRTTENLTSNHLGSKGIYNLICNLWEIAREHIDETLPDHIIKSKGLMSLHEALKNIHFPTDPESLQKAEYRLKFEELFAIQLGILCRKENRVRSGHGFIFNKVGDLFNNFYSGHLPFELTDAQKRVIKEIRADTVTGYQMNRLLQGDVGSGKTLVALMSMLLAADNEFQSCLMAPTEILARQHYATISTLLGKLPVNIGILTGTTRAKEREQILAGLAAGEIHILVGTHALIEDRVVFQNLGFVVIDEQHRFGVEQRARLWTKNNNPPHVLVMTATPIPRTLSMTLYGDLDVSVIDELPPGRKPIKTHHVRDSQRLRVLGFIREQLALRRQVYIVYPLIQESEKMDYKDLQEGFESICREFPPPEHVVAVVHGKMKPAEKELNMGLFKNGSAHILVATSVIEVGVDVPNASVMIIESAERFGLSQLHQLRGRVGRGAEQSYCILMSGDKLSREAQARLEAMVETTDGFVLSELDLKLRGGGDIAGTQQSGMAFELKIANLGRDGQVLETARHTAEAVLKDDPDLSGQQNKLLVTLRDRYTAEKNKDFSRIS